MQYAGLIFTDDSKKQRGLDWEYQAGAASQGCQTGSPFLMIFAISRFPSTVCVLVLTAFLCRADPVAPTNAPAADATLKRLVVSLRVERQKSAFEARFLSDLGLRSPDAVKMPKAFAAWWQDVDRWGVQMVALNARVQSRSLYPEVRLADLCRIGSGGTPSRRRSDYFGGAIPWVQTTEVRKEIITSTEETLTEEGLRNSSARLYAKGSLIVAMYGQGATRGRTAKLGIEAATNQACAVIFDIDERRVETDFLWYFLMSQYEAMRLLASGNNQPNLNAEMIANLRIPLPPKEEQQQILKRVAASREEIARELVGAAHLKREVKVEVEDLILGTKRVSEL